MKKSVVVRPWADYGKGFEAQRSMSQSEGSPFMILAQRPGADVGKFVEILNRGEEPLKLIAI